MVVAWVLKLESRCDYIFFSLIELLTSLEVCDQWSDFKLHQMQKNLLSLALVQLSYELGQGKKVVGLNWNLLGVNVVNLVK